MLQNDNTLGLLCKLDVNRVPVPGEKVIAKDNQGKSQLYEVLDVYFSNNENTNVIVKPIELTNTHLYIIKALIKRFN